MMGQGFVEAIGRRMVLGLLLILLGTLLLGVGLGLGFQYAWKRLEEKFKQADLVGAGGQHPEERSEKE